MLVLLVVLLIPCALVSALVSCDESWLRSSGVTAGAFCFPYARSSFREVVREASTNIIGARREERAPAPVTMLISAPSYCATTKSLHGGGGCGGDEGLDRCSSAVVWPCAPGGVSGASRTRRASDNNLFRRRQRSGSLTSGTVSDSALHAMAIPARCALPSVDLLRQAYGPRRSFWGDLTPAETRRFYHELLPVSVYLEAVGAKKLDDGKDRPLGGGMSGGGLATVVDVANQQQGGYWECFFGAAESLEERARLASMARHAARLYVRERCRLPSRVVAHLYDGLRHLKQYGSFRVTGMTWEELWDKYEKKILAEDPTLEDEDLKTRVCLRILEKSCATSEVFNNLSGCSELNTFLPDTVYPAGTVPTPELEEACAAESAAACAGAIRLIPLIKPFRRAQHHSDDAVVIQRKRARRHARRRRILAGRRRLSRRSSNRPRTTTA